VLRSRDHGHACLHHGDTGEAASLIRTTFAGFTGALLLALKTGTEKASDQHNNGNGHAPDPQPAPSAVLTRVAGKELS